MPMGNAFLNVPSLISYSLRVSSSVIGRPSSSHCFSRVAASFGDVRWDGSMPGTPKAMISCLIRTSMRRNGLMVGAADLRLQICEAGPIAELGQQAFDLLIRHRRRTG